MTVKLPNFHSFNFFCRFFFFIKKLNEQKVEMDSDVDAANDNIEFAENNVECRPSTRGALKATKSILKNRTLSTNDKAASSNDLNAIHTIVIDDEPLNLTITSCDQPLDLSIKNPK